MKADIELEKLLYRVIDAYPDGKEAIHRCATSYYDVTEIEVRPFTIPRYYDGEELRYPEIQVLARIEGKVEGRQFLALLQCHHDPKGGIKEVVWHVDNETALCDWITLFQLKGKPGLTPRERPRAPIDQSIQHCWAWGCAHVIHSECDENTKNFSQWVRQTINPDIQEVYLGDHQYTEEEVRKAGLEANVGTRFWCVPSLTTLTPFNHYSGPLKRVPGATRHRVVDIMSFACINWYVLGEIRKKWPIHIFHDDDAFGLIQIDRTMFTKLEYAQEQLKQYLYDKHGDRLNLLLDRLNWTPGDFAFYQEVDNVDVWRQPKWQCPMPSIEWFLPYV